MEPDQFSQNYTPLKTTHAKKPFPFLILLLCAFFIGNVIGLIIFVTRVDHSSSTLTYSVKAAVNEDSRLDTIQIIGTSSTSYKSDPQEPDIYGATMKFTSYKLGVAFNYLTHLWKKTDSIENKPTDVFISRSLNKVCLTYNIPNSSENCSSGQYFLMLKKDPQTSLKKTVEEEVLKKNSNCAVNTYKSGEKEIAEVVPLTNKCPEEYSKKRVQRYFQYDSKFPDRFVFVSLSQYPILADTNYNTWEKTLTLFDSK